MKKTTFFMLTLAFLSQLVLRSQPLTYTISPGNWGGKPTLRVTISLVGTQRGETILRYDDNQFGKPDQMNYVQFEPTQPRLIAAKDPAQNRFVLRHAPGERLQFEYQVLDLQQDSQSFYQYCCYQPVIRKNYFHVQSCYLLAVPEGYWAGKQDQKPVCFLWQGFPDSMALHHSFGANSTQTTLTNLEELGSVLFVGGDWVRKKFGAPGQETYILTRGTWQNFSSDTLTTLLRRVMEGHRAFWGDFSDSLYSVSFMPIDDAPWDAAQTVCLLGGSGLTNSFLSYATNNPCVQIDQVRFLYMHELMHHWIGGKIAIADAGGEERMYWFSEGFTEYFTMKNSLRYGLTNTEEFMRTLNQFSSQLYASPLREMPNDSLNYERFWGNDRNWADLPYKRGCLYAFYLDNAIKQRSGGKKSLDDMMRSIFVALSRDSTQKAELVFFEKQLRQFAGKRSLRKFKRYIENGRPIDFMQSPLPEGMTVEVRDIKVNYGPSKEVIVGTHELKNIPVFGIKKGMTWAEMREKILQ